MDAIPASSGVRRQRTTIAHFVAGLRGRAQQFSSELESDVLYDHERLKRAFQERFDPGTLQIVFRNQLRTRVQRTGENLADFAIDIQRLARRAYAGRQQDVIEEHAVEQFVAGIRDLEVQIATRDGNPTMLSADRNLALHLTENRRMARMYRRLPGTAEIRAAALQDPTDSNTTPSGNTSGSN